MRTGWREVISGVIFISVDIQLQGVTGECFCIFTDSLGDTAGDFKGLDTLRKSMKIYLHQRKSKTTSCKVKFSSFCPTGVFFTPNI